MLTEVLSISKGAVLTQALSRWLLQVRESPETKWEWYLERPFNRSNGHRKANGAHRVEVKAHMYEEVSALAETLNVSLSAVVEQALLRWCREEPPLVRSELQHHAEEHHPGV